MPLQQSTDKCFNISVPQNFEGIVEAMRLVHRNVCNNRPMGIILFCQCSRVLNCLPNGNIIIFGTYSFHCAEFLFQSNFIAMEASSFLDTSFFNNMKCDVYIRMDLNRLHDQVCREY